MTVLRSRDNPRVKRWAKLIRDGGLRKKEKRLLVEGPHLVSAALGQRIRLRALLVTEKSLADPEIRALADKAGVAPVVLSEAVFRSVTDADSPQGIAAELDIPRPLPAADGPWVFLEGVQDAGNAGAIVRSAAAFGCSTVVLDQGCADAWSPKVLRAGMGGHFLLCIRQVASLLEELDGFEGRLVCTVPTDGASLKDADLSGPLGWIFGSEGQGVSRALQGKASLRVSIKTAPGTESLNVAAAAAICLYEGFSRPAAGS